MFWALTRADWPKSRGWQCGHNYAYHRHHGKCQKDRDLTKSRDRRVVVSYLWPLLFPFMIISFVAYGSYKVITYPITNSVERRAQRFALEQDITAARVHPRHAAEPTVPTPVSPTVPQQVASPDELTGGFGVPRHEEYPTIPSEPPTIPQEAVR